MVHIKIAMSLEIELIYVDVFNVKFNKYNEHISQLPGILQIATIRDYTIYQMIYS